MGNAEWVTFGMLVVFLFYTMRLFGSKTVSSGTVLQQKHMTIYLVPLEAMKCPLCFYSCYWC